MSTSEDYQGDDSSKEDMLRTHVALLKQELEQERANKKQLHHDKVREIKSVREKEQAAARDQMEAMKLKLQKEKTQELKALRDDLTKDFKTQIKSTQKAHEEELHNAKKSYKKELQALKDKYKEEVRAQVEYEMGWKFEAERKKVTHELFEMDTRLKKAEEKAANLTAADKIKGDALREKEKKHTAEMEALHKQHHLHTKKQLEELEAQKRTIVAKEKEIVQVSERLSRTQASHEKLEEELKIMRLADSWSRRSRSASPALSPSSSIDDLASSTKRERDMVIRNSELSFRVRVLEDKIASLTEDKANLQEKLAKSESQLNPLRAHITKQSHRINNLNTSLNSREKKLKQLSDDNLQLKTACQHLEEELGRKRKTLQEQMKKNSENRSKLQKLVVQNNELSTNNNSLADQVDELEELNQSLNERLSLSSLPTSPSPPSPLHISHTPLSPTPLSPTFSSPPPMSPTFSDDDLMSSISSCGLMEQLEFEKDEMQVKYEEMKNEYSDLKAKYKTLKKTHDQLQSKHRELHSHYKQVQESLELLKKEQLQLEHEVVLLRRVSQPSPFDRERHELVMEDLQEQLEERDARITELEDFIIEQDEVSRKSEEVWKKEKRQLTQLLSQKQMTTPEQMKLRKISDKPVTSAEERIAQLEENAERLREQLKDTRANSTVMDSKLKENVQLLAQTQDTVRELSDIDAALLATEKSPRASAKVSRDEGHREDEVPSTGSPLVGAQLQQYVEQCKSQLRAKEDENQALRNSLAAAQLSVSRLQSSMVALEGSTTNYNAILAEKEDTIQQLTTQLSQMDAKLTRLRRAAMPVTVSGQEHAHAVKRAIENVMSAAESGDPNALPRELAALEKALNELLKKLFPGEDLNVSPSHKQKDMKTTQPSSLEEDEVLDEGSPTPVSSDHSLSPPNILHSLTTEQTQETLSSDEVNRSPAHTPLTPSSVDQQQHGLPSLDDIPPSQPQLQTPPGSPTASHTPLMSSAMDQQQHSLPSLDDIPPSQPQLQTPPGSPTASHTPLMSSAMDQQQHSLPSLDDIPPSQPQLQTPPGSPTASHTPLTSSAMDQQPSTPSENTTSQPLETPPPPAIHLQESTNTPPESPPTKTSSDRPPSPTLSDDIDYPLFPPERQSRSLRPLEDSSHGDTEPSFQPTTTTTIHSTQAPPLPPPLASWESEDLNSTDSTGSLLIERGDSDFSTTPPLTTYPPDDDNDDDLLHHDEFEAPPPPPPDTFPNTITEWADLQEDTPTSLQSAPPSSTDTFEHSNAQVSQHPAMPILSSDTYPDNLYTIPTHLTEATPTLSMGTTQISTQEEAPPPPVPATPPPRPSEGTTSDNDETALSPEPPNMNLPLHNAVIQPIEEAGVQSYSPLESPVIPTPSAGGLESNRDGRDKAKMTSDLSNTFTVGTMTDELPRNEDKGHTETLTPSSPHQPQRRTRKDEMMSTLDDDGDPLTYQHHPSSKTSRGHDIPTTTASTQLSSQDSADFEEGEQTRPFSHHRNPRAPIGGSHWDTPPSNHYSEPNTSSHKTPPHVSSEPGQNESFNEAYTNMHQLPHHLHDSVMRKPPTRTQHEQPEVSPPTTNTYNHHYHQPQTQTNQSGRGSSSSTYSAPLRNGIESPSIYDDQVHSGKHRSRTPRDRRHPLHTPQQHQQLSNEGAQLHRAHQDKQRTPRDYSRSTPRQKTQLTQPQPQPQHPSQNRQYKSKQHPGGVYPGSHSNYQGSSPSSQPSAVAAAAVGGPRVFVAVMDYDPDSLCITGKPGKELAVHTGDVLAVHGEMDAMGYYSASFGNQTGLVPANFIQEMDIQDQRMRERLFNQKLSRTTTPLGTLSYASLEDTPTSWDKYTTSILLKPREIDCPRPPSQFQVEKALGHSVLLVSWQAPAMDSENRSNGCLVTGYQIYVNGETKMLVSGAKQTKALLPGLKISQPLNLGVSTSSVEGKSSEMVTITYKGRRPLSAHSSCSNTSETEPYRMFVALYDYDPAKSSPSENPEFELPLKEGELIKVFGKELSDGFLVGEINDRRGLVPANFVSEVNRVAQNKQPAGSSFNSSQQTDTEVSDGTTSPRLPATSKKMAAVFDYTPEKDSPNPNPELELSFKTGDTITVYGNMHSDGFYSGELNGEFGLVPSNFLKEIQRSTLNSSPMSTTTPTRWSHPPMTHNGDISGSVDASIFTEHDFQDMVERSTLQSSEKKATAAENERPRTHSSPVKAKPVGEQPKKKRSYRLPFRKDWIKSHKKSEPELI